MITLIFLVCLPTGDCSTSAPDVLFINEGQCEVAAQNILLETQIKTSRGELPPHTARYQCISWGKPA
jgi:hypothetical protein